MREREAAWANPIIGGKPATIQKAARRAAYMGGYHVFWCRTLPATGLPITLELSTDAKVEATILDAVQGLPPSGKLLLDLRAPLGTPWGLRGDLWVLSSQAKL